MSEDEIEMFLKNFKTAPCERYDHHDHRLCNFYHDFQKDGRRDPYKEFFDVNDSTSCLRVTQIEILYHPSIFRTTLCIDKSCPFKDLCSRAHGVENLRNRREATQMYEEALSFTSHTRCSQKTLSMYIPQPKNYTNLCKERWELRRITPRSFVGLSTYQIILIKKSRTLLLDLQEIALEEGLCTITETRNHGAEYGLLIRGHEIEQIVNRVLDSFLPPSTHFHNKVCIYSQRIIDSLKDILIEQKQSISDSDFVHIESDLKKCTLHFWAVPSPSQSAESLIRTAREKIDFWVQQEGYNEYAECVCCMDKFNLDQGITCPKGHFYCSEGDEGGCFGLSVQAQLSQITATGNILSCPSCSIQYSNKSVASVLPTNLWEMLQEAHVSFRVSKNTEELAREFDQRLDVKVQELLEEYGTANSLLKAEAKRHAQIARNTILNLSCPHCGIAYAEFDGCMALRCSSCAGDFCGYCHDKFTSGRGAHCHVRECILNVTDNGSYYANADQIKRGQRAYRIRTMKKFVRRYKKAVQNAIIIELSQDLEDLDIDPSALFDVGSIHDEMILENNQGA